MPFCPVRANLDNKILKNQNKILLAENKQMLSAVWGFDMTTGGVFVKTVFSFFRFNNLGSYYPGSRCFIISIM